MNFKNYGALSMAASKKKNILMKSSLQHIVRCWMLVMFLFIWINGQPNEWNPSNGEDEGRRCICGNIALFFSICCRCFQVMKCWLPDSLDCLLGSRSVVNKNVHAHSSEYINYHCMGRGERHELPWLIQLFKIVSFFSISCWKTPIQTIWFHTKDIDDKWNNEK